MSNRGLFAFQLLIINFSILSINLMINNVWVLINLKLKSYEFRNCSKMEFFC